MRHSLLILAGLTLLAGCAAGARPSVQGLYVHGFEVESFQPCGEAVAYRLLASPSAGGFLARRHKALTEAPDQPVFIGVRGQSSTETVEGFAEKYAGYFKVEEVLFVRSPRPDDCAAGK